MKASNQQNEVYTVVLSAGLPETMARLITAQATHETANFKSNVFLKTNNAFGMKVPRIRKTTFILKPSEIVRKSEGSTPYAQYSSVKNSVLDLINWLQYNRADYTKLKNTVDYSTFLKTKGFYGASLEEYLSGLNRFFKNVTDLKQTVTILPLVLIVALSIYFFTSYKN